MPFTACHAAVGYPLARRGLILSALVVGSMAPDFEFFLRLSLASRWGHTLPGALMLTLPTALAVLWTFHAVVKRPLVALAPFAIQEALAPVAGHFPFLPLPRLARVVVSLLIGIFSHMVFDTFTHKADWAVMTFAFLRVVVPLPLGLSTPLYHLLQHVLSVTLGAMLLAQCLRWMRRRNLDLFAVTMAAVFGPAPRVIAALAIPAVVLGLFYAGACVPAVHDFRTLQLFSSRAFCAACAAFFLEFLAFAWINRLPVLERSESLESRALKDAR